MKVEAKITLYRIQHCGFYMHGNTLPAFGDVPEMLSSLRRWIKVRKPTIHDTMTFSADDHADYLPVYCYDICEEPTDSTYVLTTWNETPTVAGGYAAVQGADAAGEATVTTSSVPKGAIPGYPTYFYFVPEARLLATIQFERQNGHQGLQRYIKNYLARFSPWVVRADNHTHPLDVEIIGYALPNTDVSQHLLPRFKSRRIRNRGKLQEIRANRKRIRKVLRKDELTADSSLRSKGVLRALLSDLYRYNLTQPLPTTRFRYEVSLRPSKDELNQIIKTWYASHTDDDHGSWKDVGFVLTDDSTYWLSSSLARMDTTVDIAKSNNAVYDSWSLLEAMSSLKGSLLELSKEASRGR